METSEPASPSGAERSCETALGRIIAHRSVGLLLVAAMCALSFWFNLDGTTLWDPDEGRHAEIAREMLTSGQWLTPTLNGQPYHDKPVLFYWLVALSMCACGENAWAARMPSAVAATASVVMTAWWGRRFLGPSTGTIAGLILASAGLFVGLGRLTLLDMTYTCWLSAALFYASAWAFSGRARDWPVWPLYALLALAALTKGPAAPVLAAAILLVLTYRVGLPLRAWRPLHGALVFGLVAGPWYLAGAIVAPAYLYEFVWTHNIQRFATGSVGHPLRVFAYFYYLPATFLPWSLFWPLALYKLRGRGGHPLPLAVELCVTWVAVIFVFFTISAAKLATYMLPIFPPLALLTATALGEAFRSEALPRASQLAYRCVFYAIEVLCVVLAVATIYLGHRFWPGAVLSGLVPLLLVIPIPLGLGHYFLRSRRPALLVPTIFTLTVLLLFGIYGWFVPWLNDAFSLAPAAVLTGHLPPERRIFTVDSPPGSLSFYVKAPVQRLETLKEAGQRLSEPEPTAIVTKSKRLAEIATYVTGPAYVWWESSRIKVLVVNRPPPEGRGIPVVPLATTGGS